MMRFCTSFLVLALATATSTRAQFNFKTLVDPLAGSGFGQGTFAQGASGNTVVGYYQDSSGKFHGFSYDGSNYTALDNPLGNDQQGTQAYGVSGNAIVGYYEQKTGTQSGFHGFIYSGGTYQAVDDPAAGVEGTQIFGISGSTVVGSYFDSQGNLHGFSYDGSTFKNFDDPQGSQTTARGINGNAIVGTYQDSNGQHGFRYDGATFTNFDVPTTSAGATTTAASNTSASGISGGTIVGNFSASIVTHNNGIQIVNTQLGYLYDGSTFFTFADPAARNSGGFGTDAQGISGNTVVGYYSPASGGGMASFVTTVPEPTAGGVFIFASGMLMRRRSKSKVAA